MSDVDVNVELSSIYDAMGEDAKEFIDAMSIVQAIIDDPHAFHGKRAAVEANRLAALRTLIGVKSQYYKTAEKSIRNTKKRNVLMTMYQALEENINTLKLLARLEGDSLR